MRMHKRWITTLALLAFPALLWSQETPKAPIQSTRADLLRAVQAKAAAEKAMRMDIFSLSYYPAGELADILRVLVPQDQVTITSDEHSNRLIVAAPSDQLEQIQRVIAELDTPAHDGPEAQQVMYRIYMLEQPSEHENLRPFSLVLEGTSLLRATELLDAVQDADMRIDSLEQKPEDDKWQQWELFIEGRAASNASIKRVLEKMPASQLTELRWNEEISTLPTGHVTPLPAELKKHIDQLLGQGVQTVGYWFGNLSAPGEIRAPIGPWVFELNVDTTPRADEVELGVSVVRETPDKPDMTWQILSNSIRAHLLKPVIIGYNRDNYGTRTLGALVIVPSEQ